MSTTSAQLQERNGATTLNGKPFTLIGPELKPGDTAPDFDVVNDSLQPMNLASTGAAVRIFSVVPSLDTPVCDAQTKRFNDEAAKLPNLEIYGQHGSPVRPKALVGHVRRRQYKNAFRSPERLFRPGVRDLDQGASDRKPGDFRGG